MSYSLHNFQNGEIIEAPPINEMDAQIKTNEENISNKMNKDAISITDDGNGNVTFAVT